MRSVVSTISTKGQVTIPAEIRRHLGVGDHDQVAFVIENNQVRLQPVEFTLASAYGSVEPTSHPEDFETVTSKAKEERAKRAIAKLKRR
jgi:antitoxin PrlF